MTSDYEANSNVESQANIDMPKDEWKGFESAYDKVIVQKKKQRRELRIFNVVIFTIIIIFVFVVYYVFDKEKKDRNAQFEREKAERNKLIMEAINKIDKAKDDAKADFSKAMENNDKLAKFVKSLNKEYTAGIKTLQEEKADKSAIEDKFVTIRNDVTSNKNASDEAISGLSSQINAVKDQTQDNTEKLKAERDSIENDKKAILTELNDLNSNVNKKADEDNTAKALKQLTDYGKSISKRIEDIEKNIGSLQQDKVKLQELEKIMSAQKSDIEKLFNALPNIPAKK